MSEAKKLWELVREMEEIEPDHTLNLIIATLLGNYGKEGRCIPGLITGEEMPKVQMLINVCEFYHKAYQESKTFRAQLTEAQGEISKLHTSIEEYEIENDKWRNYYNNLKQENAALRATLAEKEAEIAAIRELMNCYNIGGWTDSIEPMKRALKAEAELAEERHENEQLIALRDEYEELVGNVALILGCTDEWSNCHDHRCCIVENATEITHKLAELRERLNKSWEREDKMSDDVLKYFIENAELRERLKLVEYQKYEFCKDVECTALEYNACNAYVCYKTAKHFHRWLEQNGYAIVKAIKAVCEGK